VSEQYANLFAQQLGLSFISLRLFNVFGARQAPTSQYSGVISIFTNAMQEGLPITIYGTGMQTRDFIYVKDVANAFTKALTISLPSGFCQACNVGTSETTSLLEIVNILKPWFPQWDSPMRFTTARPGDIQHSQADISRLSSILGFTPQWSVESGLRILVESLA
jgi:UDP-glucose 4-epimerase